MHGEDHTHITDLTNLSRRTGRSRLGKYRRQRRRRRRRRVVAIAVVTLACGLGSAYYLSNNYEAAGILANLPIVKDLQPAAGPARGAPPRIDRQLVPIRLLPRIDVTT